MAEWSWRIKRYRTGLGGTSRETVVGAVIMLGTLFGLIALIFALVWYFDPEARRDSKGDQ